MEDFIDMGSDVDLGLDTLPHLEKVGNSNIIIEKILDPSDEKDDDLCVIRGYSYFVFKIRDKGWHVCTEGVVAEKTIRRMRTAINDSGKPLRTYLKLGQGNKLMFLPWKEELEMTRNE